MEAVKVTREGGLKEGEDVVFHEEKSAKGKKAPPITPVKEAPECQDFADFYSFESRQTIGRLLRKYLDENGLLAIELMHEYGHLKSLLRHDDMLTKAVHKHRLGPGQGERWQATRKGRPALHRRRRDRGARPGFR